MLDCYSSLSLSVVESKAYFRPQTFWIVLTCLPTLSWLKVNLFRSSINRSLPIYIFHTSFLSGVEDFHNQAKLGLGLELTWDAILQKAELVHISSIQVPHVIQDSWIDRPTSIHDTLTCILRVVLPDACWARLNLLLISTYKFMQYDLLRFIQERGLNHKQLIS